MGTGKKHIRSTVLFCNHLTRWRESDKITALPTVTKESSNGDFSEVACYDLRYYSRFLQPALFGLQEVKGKNYSPRTSFGLYLIVLKTEFSKYWVTLDTEVLMAGAPAFLTWEHLTPHWKMDAGTAQARWPRPARPQGTAWSRGPRPISLGPQRAVGSSPEALTHVLCVQLYGRHLFERNVASPAVPAAAQAAPRRRGHGAATQPRRSAGARVLLGPGSFAARTATPGPGGEAEAEARPPGEGARTARGGGAFVGKWAGPAGLKEGVAGGLGDVER